jgi:hypothetical protein
VNGRMLKVCLVEGKKRSVWHIALSGAGYGDKCWEIRKAVPHDRASRCLAFGFHLTKAVRRVRLL